jgi:hypothetical protein
MIPRDRNDPIEQADDRATESRRGVAEIDIETGETIHEESEAVHPGEEEDEDDTLPL